VVITPARQYSAPPTLTTGQCLGQAAELCPRKNAAKHLDEIAEFKAHNPLGEGVHAN
jgi:hypothetical protein